MKRLLSLAGFAGAAVLGLCGFFLQSAPPSSPPPPPSGFCSNPAVPRPAQAAGFTELAYCADFSTNTGTNNFYLRAPLTTNWASMAWLSCTIGALPAGRQWVAEYSGFPSNPCSDVAIAPDPMVSGGQVLQLSVVPADGTSNGQNTTLASATIGATGGSWLPNTNMYSEVVIRLAPAERSNVPLPAPQSELAVWASQRGNSPGPSDGNVETDWDEQFFPSSAGAFEMHDYTNGPPTSSGGANDIAGINDTNYHTVASLTTANASGGSRDEAMCIYLDGHPQGTSGGTNPSGNCAWLPALSHYNYTQVGQVFLSNTANADHAVTGPVHLWIQSIRVWSCPNWSTTPGSNSDTTGSTCAPTQVFNGTPP